MADLSPEAQAVLDATDYPEDWATRVRVAAALRAAADEVAPSDLDEPRNYLPMAMECQRIRKELLAIATELEGAND